VKKILVATDFSDHSKSGLRFAIQLASQDAYHLTFFHVHHLQTPTVWDAVRMSEYEDEQKEVISGQMGDFVGEIYATMHMEPKHIQCAVELSILTESTILEYAEQNKYDYICISTRGTSLLKKLLGTITSTLINRSKIPVIVVPHDYKIGKIKSVLYASDLDDYESEIIQVVSFAKPLEASVKLLNFTSEPLKEEKWKIFETNIEKITNYPVNIQITKKKLNDDDLITALESAVKKNKPSVLIMFTKHNRKWFEHIFYAGNSTEYSFHTKVPLLVFSKP
jgi:nucleotide-binding universal stress UspA family protein